MRHQSLDFLLMSLRDQARTHSSCCAKRPRQLAGVIAFSSSQFQAARLYRLRSICMRSSGTHQAVFFSAGYDNTLQARIVNFTVSSTNPCPVPSSPGLNVCTPINSLTTGSPVQVMAPGNITGTIARMEVWVDGVKKFSTFGSSTLQTSFPLPAGAHRFGFFVVNSAGSVRNQVVFSAIR
jgi:hypothetical protein